MTDAFGDARLRENGPRSGWRVWRLRCAATCVAVVVSVVLASCGSGSTARLADNVMAGAAQGAHRSDGTSGRTGTGSRKDPSVGSGERARSLAAARREARSLTSRSRLQAESRKARHLLASRSLRRSRRAVAAVERRATAQSKAARARGKAIAKLVLASNLGSCLKRSGALAESREQGRHVSLSAAKHERALVLGCMHKGLTAAKSLHKTSRMGARS